ncbi:FAD-dependent thymidylate synthase [Patulibacter minatonensis]|uniref:FAD-dependent thymidylate synthase n=1 Tax=Patulibacter minatonensis TaxID=298163 RepID=UPI0012FCAEB1|nr:FAD-dependent thymidylate synthase [Patulibacter minatonensis]
MQYPIDALTDDEAARLAPHVTHPTRPVFGLVGLPETVKGALFARYSRYPGTLRRLFLDEFADSLPELGASAAYDGAEGERAAQLYDRIFLGYGDDSVAQLGGLHVAAEWCSNVLTKLLQRPRIGAYLEQSTRYIAFDDAVTAERWLAEGAPGAGAGAAGHGAPLAGPGAVPSGVGAGPDVVSATGTAPGAEAGYRYLRDPALGPVYASAMDDVFGVYAALLPRMTAWCAEQYPAPDGTPPAAHERAIKAKALDLLRGLLPASTLSHVGIYASGQTYEGLILHLLAHPLPEARRYGRWILEAVQAITPSFVTRVERPERGGRWIEFLQEREAAADRWAGRLGLDAASADARDAEEQRASVRLVHVDGDEDDLLAGLLYESTAVGEDRARAAVAGLSTEERGALLSDLVGERENRRHRPGRGLERLRYRFDVVSDYGAFRDLQRHRMLTIQWQTLTPELGAEVPDEVERAGAGGEYRRALDRSAEAWAALRGEGRPKEAAYAVSLGYRIRYSMDLNARAAMQMIELRSGREGHPSYRAVAHEMHRLISEAHPAIGAAMRHVDASTEPRITSLMGSSLSPARRASRSSTTRTSSRSPAIVTTSATATSARSRPD